MQFKDPEIIAQSMVLDPTTQSKIGQGILVPKPFSALCAVPVRCEFGKFNSEDKNITSKEDQELMSQELRKNAILHLKKLIILIKTLVLYALFQQHDF